MRPNEPDEPGSDDYNKKLWRRSRNEKVLNCTQPLKGVAGTSRWDEPVGYFNNGSQPTKMCFHQFEDHLVIADDRDSIWYVIPLPVLLCVLNMPGRRGSMER